MTAQRRFRAGHRARLELTACAAIAVALAAFALAPPTPAPAASAPEEVFELVDIRSSPPDLVEPVPPAPEAPREPFVAPPEPAEVVVAAADAPEPPAPVVPETAPAPGVPAPPFESFSTPPAPVRTVDPEYPEMARKLGIEGLVTCAVTIDTKGRVTAVEVIGSASPMLDEAARKALLEWVFSPALQSGQPVPSQVVVPVRFALNGSR